MLFADIGLSLPYLVVGVLVVGGLATGVWLYLRGRASREEVYSHFRCPGCKRRIRYKSTQVGNRGECSNCGKSLIFPPLSESID
jgi:predicted RNA-binding Zn-ribbon protein involved in translation (DUF1610 family)